MQQPGYTVRRCYVDTFLARSLPADTTLTLLDIGGYRGVKRGSFDVTARFPRSVSLNIVTKYPCDLLAGAQLMPFPENTFDTVLCSEVLEHVPDPARVIAEMFRVLRPGGQAVITTPFLYRVHGDPDDYWRFTPSALRVLFEHAGFHITTIEQHGMLNAVLADFARQIVSNTRFVRPFNRVADLVTAVTARAVLGQTHPGRFARSFATGYGLIATRPR